MNNRIVFTNNTGYDIRDFDSVFIKCVLENLPLPEEIADIFELKIITVDGLPRGILNFA
jgi:hypothetical protein